MTQRDLAWPEGATLAKQLWGSADELKRTVKFIEDVSPNNSGDQQMSSRGPSSSSRTSASMSDM
jgi:hypothetical protein